MSEQKADYSITGVKNLAASLEELYARRDLLKIQHNDARNAVVPEDVKSAVADVDAEFAPMLEGIAQKIEKAEAEVKKAVLDIGETISTENIQVIYKKGAVSWDSKKLDGLMIVIPQLEQARKQGEPSAYIKTRKAA